MGKVVLVDKKDNTIGEEEKILAHKKGLLHRAFSIFIFNNKRQLLIQKRAKRKYHSGGLWTNSCCGHPESGEEVESAAKRRLKQEIGFSCDLEKAFSFIYKVKFDNGLIENEYDHVFFGRYNGRVNPNPDEVSDWKWVDLRFLKKDIEANCESYTYWLKLILGKVIKLYDKIEEK